MLNSFNSRSHTTRWRLGVLLYALAIALLLTLPTISAARNTPPDTRYTGTMVVPTGFQVDYYSHMAKLWQGARGEWAYRLLFTTEPHAGLFGVQGFYVLLGTLSRSAPDDLPLVYHGARFVFNVLLIMALGAFVARYFKRPRDRWLALLFATLVTGWGWLMYSVAPAFTTPDPPIEFWLMDAYHLTGGLFMPHFSAAALLQLLTVILLDDWRLKGGFPRIVLLTLIMAASAIVQPYIVLLMLPLITLYAGYTLVFLPRRDGQPIQGRIVWLALPMGVQGLIAVAQFLALTSDPIWRSFTAQNITLSPTPIHYLFGYAPLLLPILGTLIVLARRRAIRWPAAQEAHWLIPILWALLVGLLIYAPLPTQRRYLLGVQSALAVLAAWGWVRLLFPRLGARKWLVTVAYMGSAMISLIMLIMLNVNGLIADLHPEIYVSDDWRQAAAWIRENTPQNAHILTVMDTEGRGSGGPVVWLTGRTVFIGHWIETADFASKVWAVQAFYSPQTPDEDRLAFVQQHGIDLIWYDHWATFTGSWSPASSDDFVPVFTSASVTLYAPKLGSAP